MKRCPATCICAMLGLLAAHLALPHIALVQTAFAQPGFPARTVKFIVPFPAGGINDVLARIVADKLQVKWGQPIIIENKTGAGGNIGADLAYQAEPDGYTLLLAPPGPLAINQSLYKHLSYKPEEFVPITVVGTVPNCRHRAQGTAGQLAQGADRLRQGQPGQGGVRQPGQRRDAASHRQ